MRTFTVPFTKVGVTAAVDLFEIAPADDKPCEVVGLFLAQSSDPGDIQSELLPYKVIRGHATSGSGGSAPTIRALDGNDGAASFAAEANNTTAAKEGTEEIIHASVFNAQVGEALWLPETCGWRVSQLQSRLVVRLASAPADELTMSGTLYVREF